MNYNFTNKGIEIVDCSSADQVITVPATGTHPYSRSLTYIKSGTYKLTLEPIGADTIGSVVGIETTDSGSSSVTLFEESGNWIIVEIINNWTIESTTTPVPGTSSGLSLGETSTTAYRGDRGKTAYDHSQGDGSDHSEVAANSADRHTHTNKSILDNTEASYTSVEENKLSGIEDNATADQTDAEIKTAYENNADTNAYTDSEKTEVSDNSSYRGVGHLPLAGGILTGLVTASSLKFPSGATVSEIETILTSSTTKMPSSKAVSDAIAGGSSSIRPGIKQILGGYGAGLLLTDEGKVYTFFDNGASYPNAIYAQSSAVKQSPLYGMIENITQIYVSDNPFTQIAVIGNSAFALDDTGDLYAWGENTVGTLGLGHVIDTFLPTLSATSVDSILAPDRGLCDTTATTSCAFIKKTDGKIYGTGLNTSGQLGIGSATNVNVWTEITALTGKNVTAFYQTQNCAAPIVAIVDDTDVWVAGENSNGQLGDGTTTDITTMTDMSTAWNPNGYPVKKAVAGGVTAKISLSMVLEKSSTEYELRVCGDNASGQLGDGTTTDRLTPYTTKTFTSYKNVVMESHAGPLAYLTVDGDLWKVGENSYGTGGDGTTTDIKTWAHVASNVEAILTAWNGHHVTPEKQESFIRKADGVYGCGYNSYGATSCGLANGVPAVKNVTTYCKALFPPDVTIIKIGSFMTSTYSRKTYFALSSDNRIFVWSDNTSMGASSVIATYDVNIPIEANFTRR